jgi:hypothetical protein
MRLALAFVMTLTLVSVITLCPFIACPLQAGSCCHHPQSQVTPCPYSIIEKGKTSSAAVYPVAVHFLPGNPALYTAGHFSAVQPQCRLLNTSGIFLRNRVLLI